MNKLLKSSYQMMSGMKETSQALLAKNFLYLKQYDSSILVATESYKTARTKGSKQLIINLTQIISEAYQQKSRYDSALHYLQIHYSFKDSVYNLDNQRKMSTVYAELETIQKQNEIEILEKESKLQKADARIMQLIILFGAVLTLWITISLVRWYRSREKKQLLITSKLQQELDQNKKDLHQQALRIIYINNTLAEIEKALKKFKSDNTASSKDLQHILNTIQINKSLEKEWENFNEYFSNVHGSFFDMITAQYPEITLTEKRLAALIKMNLTNREIAGILNIENNSVKVAKYRLKKKLSLSEDQDINLFLQNLSGIAVNTETAALSS